MRIELGEDVLAHFQFVNASEDNRTQMYGVLAEDGVGGAAVRKHLDEHILTRCARARSSGDKMAAMPLSLLVTRARTHRDQPSFSSACRLGQCL